MNDRGELGMIKRAVTSFFCSLLSSGDFLYPRKGLLGTTISTGAWLAALLLIAICTPRPSMCLCAFLQDAGISTYLELHVTDGTRPQALKSTGARALSIMTVDVLASLRSEGWPLEEGDLGENVLVSGLSYGFFHPGKHFFVGGATVGRPPSPSTDGDKALSFHWPSMMHLRWRNRRTIFEPPLSCIPMQVEITEAIAPCGNLCRLSWLDKSTCPKFIKTLVGRWASGNLVSFPFFM